MIDPNFFYWLGFFDRLNRFTTFWFPVCIFVSAVLSFLYLVITSNIESDVERSIAQILKKSIIICLVLGILFGVLYFFIPDKENMIGMGIAKSATPENIKELTNYIVETIKQLKN